MRRLFADNGIEIASLLGYNERGNAEGVDWPSVQDDIARHIELAQRIGTKAMRVNAAQPAANSSWDAYLEGFAKDADRRPGGRQRRCAQHAEPPGSTERGAGWPARRDGAQPAVRRRVLARPLCRHGEDVLAAVETLAPVVKQLHLADREHRTARVPAARCALACPATASCPTGRSSTCSGATATTATCRSSGRSRPTLTCRTPKWRCRTSSLS